MWVQYCCVVEYAGRFASVGVWSLLNWIGIGLVVEFYWVSVESSHDSWWFSCGFHPVYPQHVWGSLWLPAIKHFHYLLYTGNPDFSHSGHSPCDSLYLPLVVTSTIKTHATSLMVWCLVVFHKTVTSVCCICVTSWTFSRISPNIVVDHCIAWRSMFNLRFADAW